MSTDHDNPTPSNKSGPCPARKEWAFDDVEPKDPPHPEGARLAALRSGGHEKKTGIRQPHKSTLAQARVGQTVEKMGQTAGKVGRPNR